MHMRSSPTWLVVTVLDGTESSTGQQWPGLFCDTCAHWPGREGDVQLREHLPKMLTVRCSSRLLQLVEDESR